MDLKVDKSIFDNIEENDDEPQKKEISYEDSDLLKALKDYNIEPDENIKRKIDYYYSPYGAINQNQKHMNFDQKHEETKKVRYGKDHKPLEEYINPS